MTVVININPTIESDVLNEAEKIGVPPSQFVTDVLSRYITKARQFRLLPETEASLLKEINIGWPEETWQHYRELVSKRENEIITPSELDELTDLSDQLEIANARRYKALISLAKIRNTSVDDLIASFGIKQPVLGQSA